MKHHGTVTPVPAGLVNVGPIVQVSLTAHPGVAASLPAPAPTIKAALMIDTGAQRTVIENSLAQAIGLTPIRFMPMVGVFQKPEMCPVYLASITIGFTDGAGGQAQLSFASEVIGMGSPATPQQHRGLLGRDFLLHVDKFVYDGKAGTFDLVLNTPPATLPGVMTREQKDALKAKHKAERQARKKSRRR